MIKRLPFLKLLTFLAALIFISLTAKNYWGAATIVVDACSTCPRQSVDARYINLESRKDRREQAEAELLSQNIHAKRINASVFNFDYGVPGAAGCSLSHIRALNSTNADIALIFEDDFQFLEKFPMEDIVYPSFDWDVILFGYSGIPGKKCLLVNQSKFCRATNMETSSAYAVKKSYIPFLISVFEISLRNLLDRESKKNLPLDQIWKILQEHNNWYVYQPRVVKQRSGYSDIYKEKNIGNF